MATWFSPMARSIDVGGFAKQFFDVAAYTDAGRIALTAHGTVSMQSGAVLDLSGDTAGGGAGTLAVTSGGAGAASNGTIKAQAIAGARGGYVLARYRRLAGVRGAEPASERWPAFQIARSSAFGPARSWSME